MDEAYLSSHPTLVLFSAPLKDKIIDKHQGAGSGKIVEGKTKDSLRKGGTDTKFETRGKADKGRSPSDARSKPPDARPGSPRDRARGAHR